MEFIASFLDKTDKAPLYQQLYSHLAEEISTGRVAAGEKLPGKRSAAAQLGVSVNTVDEAYQMLAAEGYVSARERSGFIVNRLELLVPPPVAPAGRPPLAEGQANAPALAENPSGAQWRYSFSSGGLDLSLFPHKMWNRLFRDVLAGPEDLMGRGPAAGDAVLREAIVAYLRGWRGVRCTPGQVVVGAGLEVLCGMLARLLSQHLFAVEDPGYPKTVHILHNMGVAMQPIPVDGEGMPADALRRSGTGVAYLTPSHQFPTGNVMPVGRRTELLGWAGHGRYIIEDDYDSEFRFDGRPLPSLQGLDKTGSVVYAGTFSRSLAPGLRAAYLVLPPALLARWQAAYGDYACTISRPEQHTLARLMSEGHFARHLNRARIVYRRRRDALADALGAALFKDSARIENAHTGLYFLLRLAAENAPALAAHARENGLRLHALDEYYAAAPGNAKTAGALVVGYGGLADDDIRPAAKALAAVING